MENNSGCQGSLITYAILAALVVGIFIAGIGALGSGLGSGFAKEGGDFRINSHNVDLQNSGGASVVIGDENQVSSNSYPCYIDHETGRCEGDSGSDLPSKDSGYIAFAGLAVFGAVLLIFLYFVMKPTDYSYY